MSKKTRDFLKKYASSMGNISGDGVWSGRGIGVPVGGAIGGGDDYKQKIGRNKIPWNLTDFQGSPSMAADSGFSSIALKRVASPESITVSKKPMFPDQVEKDSLEADNYDLYGLEGPGLDPVRDEMKTKDLFDENVKVENTKYSLKKVDDLMVVEDVSWRDMTPDFIEDVVDDVDARDVLPDAIEDEVLAAYDHVVEFLDTVKQKYGDPAYEAINNKIENITGTDPSDVLEKAAKVAKEVGRDVIALAAAGIPILGTPIAVSYVLYNLGEMQVGMNQARKAVDSLILEGSESDVIEIEKVSSQLFDDYVDFLQAVPYLIPFVGTAKGAAGLVTKTARALGGKKATSFLGLSGSKAFGSALRSEILLSPIFKFVTGLSNVKTLDDLGINSTHFIDNVYKVPSALSILQKLREMAESQLEEWKLGDRLTPFKFELSKKESYDIEGAEERLATDDYDTDFDFDSGVDDLSDQIRSSAERDDLGSLDMDGLQEERMDREKLIRQFIREAIYHADSGDYPHPAGYSYRVPCESDDAEENEKYSADKGSLVNYKTDMGGVTYQSTPEDLREEALRRIIRRKLQEQKKTF